jgi:molybdate transport system ATP-binding protein
MSKFEIDIQKTLYGSNGNMLLDINLEIKEGSFIALTGESGSGKSTFLRILAGLESSNGEIKIGDNIWQKENLFLPPQKRQIGFVFQDYALFSNMSVEQNLLFVKKDKTLATKLLKMTNLYQLRDRLPIRLSGGQKQRVALCRAIMNRPKLLLMDEPLSALDINMRTKLQDEILLLHREFNMTTIMVSHDPSEIYRLSSRVIVLHNGKIIEDGLPKDILLKSNSLEKFSFEGELLDIIKADVIYIAVISIGQHLVEVVINKIDIKRLEIGKRVRVTTRAFSPFLESF